MMIYAVSTDTNFLNVTSVVLEPLKFEIKIFTTEEKLYKAIDEKLPFVVILDYEELPIEIIHNILDTMQTRWIQMFMSKILLHNANIMLDKSELISKGIDYFFTKPINMLELLAYFCSVERLILKCKARVNYETQVHTVETMQQLHEHLMQHVKEPIQRFMDFKLSKERNEREIKEYLLVSRKSAVEVLAAINSVRDELQSIINTSKLDYNLDNLKKLYEKNLLLTKMAYGLYSEGNEKDNTTPS